MPKKRTMGDAQRLFAGDPGECWRLPPGAGGPTGNGYYSITVSGVRWLAHRLAYVLFTGPLTDGLMIDHVCHSIDPDCDAGDGCPHRACVNPAHLELVTPRENALRGGSPPADNARLERCAMGHPYVPAPRSRGGRFCPICRHKNRLAKGEIKGNARPEAKTHCPAGHRYDEANTYVVRNVDGSFKCRQCRACHRERSRARRNSR